MGDDDTDYNELIDSFDMEDALECCKDCGIVVEGEFPLAIVKEALRNRYVRSVMTAAEVFDLLDSDKSGSLEKDEVQIAFAMLAGVLLQSDAVAGKMSEIDSDGSGTVSKEEFETWYTSFETEEEARVEKEWGAVKIQSIRRGNSGRKVVKEKHGFAVAVSLELAEKPVEVASHLMYETGEGPSEWIDIEGALELIVEGKINDETMVWTEGMEGWTLLSQCKERFGLGESDTESEGDEIDYEELIDEFDMDETIACLADFAITVDGDYSLNTLKSVLRNRYATEKKELKDVFEMLDKDGSRGLDLDECQLAAAILGGVLLEAEALKAEVAKFNTGKDKGVLSFEEFKVWWEQRHAQQLKEAAAKEQELMKDGSCVHSHSKAEPSAQAAAPASAEPAPEPAPESEPEPEAVPSAASSKAGAEPERIGGILVRKGRWGVVQRKTLARFRVEDEVGVGVDDLSKAQSLEACRRAGIVIRDEVYTKSHDSDTASPLHPVHSCSRRSVLTWHMMRWHARVRSQRRLCALHCCPSSTG